MNNKGFGQQIMTIIILGLILTGIVFLIFVIQLALPLFTTGTEEVTSLFVLTTQENNDANLTRSATVSANAISGTIVQLEWISFFFIIGLIIAFMGLAFFVRSHPFLIVFWILIMVCLILISIFLTVSYEEIKATDSYVKSSAESWESTDYMLSHLPHILTAIGLLGGIILFALISREPESEAIPI